MEDKFYQVCNKINYGTYQKIQNSFASIGFGTTVISTIFTEQYPMFNISLDIVYSASSVAYFGMLLSNAKLYTKDMSEIRTLYQQFIQSYNKMNKNFELNNPIQIYTMFNYLLYEGYLSKGKEFQFSGEETRDIIAICGTNIFMGKGVCRHISSMFKDILNDYGIEAYNLGCYSRTYEVNINTTEQQKYSYDELREWVKKHVIDERTNCFLNARIEEMEKQKKYAEFSYKQVEEKNPIKKMVGNHVICYSRYNGEDYYLDPTQTKIFRLNPNSNTLFDIEEDSGMKIKQIVSIFCNNAKDYAKMRKMLANPNPSISLEEEQELVLETKKLCEQNMDVFEQFYNDNSEIYAEITNRLVKIKKNKYATK